MINHRRSFGLGLVLGLFGFWLLRLLLPNKTNKGQAPQEKKHGLIGMFLASVAISFWLWLWIVPNFALAFCPFVVCLTFVAIDRTFGHSRASLALCFYFVVVTVVFVWIPHVSALARRAFPEPVRALYESVQTKQRAFVSETDIKTKYQQYEIERKATEAKTIQDELDKLNDKRKNGKLTAKDQKREQELQRQMEKLLGREPADQAKSEAVTKTKPNEVGMPQPASNQDVIEQQQKKLPPLLPQAPAMPPERVSPPTTEAPEKKQPEFVPLVQPDDRDWCERQKLPPEWCAQKKLKIKQ